MRKFWQDLLPIFLLTQFLSVIYRAVLYFAYGKEASGLNLLMSLAIIVLIFIFANPFAKDGKSEVD